MIYNNPISYGNDITPEMFLELAEVGHPVGGGRVEAAELEAG